MTESAPHNDDYDSNEDSYETEKAATEDQVELLVRSRFGLHLLWRPSFIFEEHNQLLTDFLCLAYHQGHDEIP